MKAASEEYNWNLQYGNIAMIFRGGCIIRAQFLQKLKKRTTAIQRCQTYCLTRTLKTLLKTINNRFAKSLQPQRCAAFQYQRSLAP